MRRFHYIIILLLLSAFAMPLTAQHVVHDRPTPTRSKRTPKVKHPQKRNADYIKNNHRDETTPKVQMRYRISGITGWLNRDDKIAGTKTMYGLKMDRPVTLGGSVAVEFLPTGRLRSLQQWNNASIGLAFSAFDLGQDQYLGQAFAPHAYLNIPLYRSKHFVFGLRPGIGIGFVTKTYANTVPEEYKWEAYQISTGGSKKQQIANISMGSIANAFLMGAVYMDFPIKKGWDITFNAGWQHLSNGSVMTPNAGYNMFNAEVGVAYTPSLGIYGMHRHEPYSEVPHHLNDGVDKPWAIEILAGGGVRSVYYKDRRWYGIATASVSAYWKPLSIFRIGIGADAFYDGAYSAVYKDFADGSTKNVTHFGKTYLTESNQVNCFRLGVSLQPEMVLGRFSFGYHIGIYMIDPVKNLEPFEEAAKGGLNRGIIYKYDPTKASTYQDGWCYQRVQLKYLATDHLLVHLGLKLHIMKAEYIDAGIGVRF